MEVLAMKKTISVLFSVCLLLTACSRSASAAERMEEALRRAIAASADEMITNMTEGTEDTYTYDLSDAYSFILLDSFVIGPYKETGDFASLMTREIRWQLPYSGGDMTFSSEGKFLGMTNDTVPTLYPSEVTALIAESLPDKNVSVTYTYSQLHTAVFVYIQDSDTREEYIIPYMTVSVLDNSGMFDPDNNQSVPAAVYRMDDFMTAMQATFDENPPTKDEEGNQLYGQGVIQLDPNADALFALTPVVMSGQTDFPVWGWVLMGAGAVLVMAGTAFGVYRSRRKAE